MALGGRSHLRAPGLLSPFCGSPNACFGQQPEKKGLWCCVMGKSGKKWGLVPAASCANPKSKSDAVHAVGSFCSVFWGHGKGNFHSKLVSSLLMDIGI